MTRDHLTMELQSRLAATIGIEPGRSRVVVIGLGKTGLSVVQFLMRCEISFAVVDNRKSPPCLADLRRLNQDAAVFLGEYDQTAFSVATHIVVSPGVSIDLPIIQKAIHLGVKLVSDIDLMCCVSRQPVVGITGSNGKSTVTTLLGSMAKKAGIRVKVGGNLGTPALDLLDEMETTELYVLELSSFQLERTSMLKPAAATVLNVSPDHMDRYADLNAYIEAKRRIFSGCDVCVINHDDPLVSAMVAADMQVVRFGLNRTTDLDVYVEPDAGEAWILLDSRRLVRTCELRIKGAHNLSNALAAVALGSAIGIPDQKMVDALRVFSGLPHRMQWIDEINGVAWINDSKATNVGACVAALNGLQGKAILIAGGDGKGADFAELKASVREKAKAVVLIGKDAELLKDILGKQAETICASHLQHAVQVAGKLAEKGDTVLLSPACASLDQFADYEERGRVFESAVKEMGRAH